MGLRNGKEIFKEGKFRSSGRSRGGKACADGFMDAFGALRGPNLYRTQEQLPGRISYWTAQEYGAGGGTGLEARLLTPASSELQVSLCITGWGVWMALFSVNLCVYDGATSQVPADNYDISAGYLVWSSSGPACPRGNLLALIPLPCSRSALTSQGWFHRVWILMW